MGLKISIIINIVLIIIILINLIKKYVKELKNALKEWGYKFLYKITEIFWILILGITMLCPIWMFYVLNGIFDISYNEYKELLEAVLNSYYIIVIGFIIIAYLFRNSLKKKIEQIKEVSGNGVKFEETQLEKNLEKLSSSNNENCISIEEKSEEIYEEVKQSIENENKKNLDNEDTLYKLQKQNYDLERELANKDAIIKREKFRNIECRLAKTTRMILLYMYNKYKTINLFNTNELQNILSNILENNKMKVEVVLEVKAIIQFLISNKIIDTEDDKNFSITEYGEEFLKYLFEGGI